MSWAVLCTEFLDELEKSLFIVHVIDIPTLIILREWGSGGRKNGGDDHKKKKNRDIKIPRIVLITRAWYLYCRLKASI
jgi:hypothetical protein